MYHSPREFKGLCLVGVNQAYLGRHASGDDERDIASARAVTNGKECSAGQQKSESMTPIDGRACNGTETTTVYSSWAF
jgi:hypothetical protein